MRKQRDRTQKLTYLLVAGTTMALTGACGDDEPEIGLGEAAVRVMDLAQAPEVDVVLNQGDATLAEGLDFRESSDYENIGAGTYRVDVIAPGAGTLATFEITVEQGAAYTLVLSGTADALNGKLFQDVFDVPEGEIRARLFHFATDRGPMTLFFLPEEGAPIRITNPVAFSQASDSVRLPDGNHDVALDLDADGTLDARYDLPPLSDGTLANLFADLDDSGDVDLVLQLNNGVTVQMNPNPIGAEGRTANVRAINLVPAAGPLSFFVGDTTVAQGLDSLSSTDYTAIPRGTYDIGIGDSADNPVAQVTGVELGEETSHTLVAFGPADAIRGVVIEDEVADIRGDRTRIRMMHAAPDVGEVDVYVFENQQPMLLFEDLDFGEVSESLEVAPIAQQIGLDTNDDGMVDVTFTTPALGAQTNVNLFVTVDGAGTPTLVTQMGGTLEMASGVTP